MSEDNIGRLREQLEDLQARYAFQEDVVSSLNDTVVSHRREIDRLNKQCRELQGALERIVAELDQSRHQEAPPPHY